MPSQNSQFSKDDTDGPLSQASEFSPSTPEADFPSETSEDVSGNPSLEVDLVPLPPGDVPPADSDVASVASRPQIPRTAINVSDVLDDPVTSHMTSASPLLNINHNVDQALATIRKASDVGRVVYFYVVDDAQCLQGVVASRRLLLSPPEAPVRELMSTSIISIPASASVLDACEYFTNHKLLAFPVVDEQRKVLGIVDVDLYTSELVEIDRRQESEDLFQLIGVHLTEASQRSTRSAFMGRFPWLLCNVLGGMLSAFIADAYEDVATLAVVAPFIALVTALAESVSIQSVSLALQALHGQLPTWAIFTRKAVFEVLVGGMLGVGCGLSVAAIAFLWKGSFAVSASLFLGIATGVTASAVVGLSIPFVLRLVRRDPQLASGPIALALSDVVTLLFYFNLGRWVL